MLNWNRKTSEQEELAMVRSNFSGGDVVMLNDEPVIVFDEDSEASDSDGNPAFGMTTDGFLICEDEDVFIIPVEATLTIE